LTLGVIGAVARPLEEYFTDQISVKSFGAKGDFSNDDTAAFKAALSYASTYSNRGCVIYVPAGIYNVSDMLTIPEFVTLKGAGKHSTMIRCTASGSVAGIVVNMPNQRSVLDGINVVYASAQLTTGTCIRSTGSSNVLRDVGFSAGFNGLQVWGGSAQKLVDIDWSDCKSCGVQIGESTGGFVNDVILQNFFGISVDKTNFQLGSLRIIGRVEAFMCSNGDLIGSKRSVVTDPGTGFGLRFSNFTNVFMDEHTDACLFTGVNHTTFTDCWLSGRDVGAVFHDCYNLTFTGQKVYNNGKTGIRFLGTCHHITMANSDLSNNNQTGSADMDDVWVSGESYEMNFIGNHGYEAGQTRSAVFISSGCHDYSIVDNKLSNRSTRNIIEPDSAVGRHVVGNSNYVTRKSGSATLAAGQTQASVLHGLNYTPKIADIRISQNGATVTPLYVDTVDAAGFTVKTAQTNTGNAPFTWVADATGD